MPCSCFIRALCKESRITAEQRPYGEMGGYGTGPTDRGIKFYYEWVRDNVGRWEYPNHLPVAQFSIEPQGTNH